MNRWRGCGSGSSLRGVSTLLMVISIFSCAQMAVFLWARISRETGRLVHRSVVGQRAQEIARSALAETLFVLERGVNQPGNPLFTTFRKLDLLRVPALIPLPTPEWSPRLFEGSGAGRIDVQCSLVDYERSCRHPLSATGRLRIVSTVTIESHVSRSITMSVSLRVQGTTLPSPMDSWVMAPTSDPTVGGITVDGSVPPESLVTRPVDTLETAWNGLQVPPGEVHPLDLFLPGPAVDAVSLWRQLAAYIVDPTYVGGRTSGMGSQPRRGLSGTGPEQVLQTWLEDRLARGGRVNGIVLWTGGGQRMSKLVFRGKAILVVPRGLEIQDLVVEDPDRDKLTIVAYGPVSTPPRSGSKRWQVSLVRCEEQSSPGGTSGGDVRVTGALIDLTGLVNSPLLGHQVGFFGSLEAHPHAEAGTDLAHTVVLLSPQLAMEAMSR